MWEVQAIGETAGQVWRYLYDNGKTSLRAVERGIEAPKEIVHAAIGWLAREGKVKFTQEGRAHQVQLTGQPNRHE